MHFDNAEIWIVSILALVALAMILFRHILELATKLAIWAINAIGDIRDAYRDRFAPEQRPPCRECHFPQQRSGPGEGSAEDGLKEGVKSADD